MKLATTPGALFFAALLCLSLPPAASGQQPEECYWKTQFGHCMSQKALYEILQQHKLWRKSKPQPGRMYVGLTGADLSGAELSGKDLSYFDLTDTILRGAILIAADLTGADLTQADLSDAFLYNAELREVTFEPTNLPPLDSIALARNLELMTYCENPGPLTQLRKEFQDGGYREQERKITYVLNRHDADPAQLRSSIHAAFNWVLRRPVNKTDKNGKSENPWGLISTASDVMPLGSFIEAAFKWIAFDLTCQYGLSYGRPLLIVLGLWLLLSGVYAWFMRRPGPSGIYFVGSRLWRGKSNTQGVRIRRRAVRATNKWKTPFLWLREEWRLRRAALFFSLMSAFNIGFRDINFGRWLRLLTRREYDLRAVGWARTVSGFQSLLSVYMIALWVLTYFGRPFG